MRRLIAPIVTTLALATGSIPSNAQVTGEVCNTGVCAPVDPVAAGALIAAAILQPNIEGNLRAAAREKTVADQILRGTIGVSVKDWKEFGWEGGRNSEARKLKKGWKKVFRGLEPRTW